MNDNNRGIYILSNDKVYDNTIALLNSLRYYDKDTPVTIIPYDSQISKIKRLCAIFDAKIFDPARAANFIKNVKKIFSGVRIERLDLLKKFLCWTGPYKEFICLDTDIVVFRKIIDICEYLKKYDFVNYDYQHRTGINNVFSAEMENGHILEKKALGDVFNVGFLCSKSSIFSEERIYDILRECRSNIAFLDTDCPEQAMLNYAVLKYVPQRINLSKIPATGMPGNWAGTKTYRIDGNRIFDPGTGQYLWYMHWAGIGIKPGGSYWETWKYYRNLHSGLPAYPERSGFLSFLFK